MKNYYINLIPEDNFLFSLIHQSQQHYQKFVLENYIDIECNLELGYAVNRYSQMFQYNDFGCFHLIQIRLAQLDLLQKDLNTFIISAIDDGYSLLLPVDTFYIQQYITFNEKHKSHVINIFGYEDNYYHCRDFFNYEKYNSQQCIQTEVDTAVLIYDQTYQESPNRNIVGLKLSDPAELKPFNIRKLYNGLNNFISWQKPVNDIFYGISWFDGVITDLNKERFGDFRILELHFFLEHTRLMIFRVQYLIEILSIVSLECVLSELFKLQVRIENKQLKLMKCSYRGSWTKHDDDKIRKETIMELQYMKEKYRELIIQIMKYLN